jgi:creatinine amidohydrolase
LHHRKNQRTESGVLGAARYELFRLWNVVLSLEKYYIALHLSRTFLKTFTLAGCCSYRYFFDRLLCTKNAGMPDFEQHIHPHLLSQAVYRDIRNASYDVAVLPWGATEAHNYHLPYGTDTISTTHIAAEAARIATTHGARIIVLPTVPFGVNTGQLDIRLTINMNPSTQLAVLQDVASSLEMQGIKKLAIINGHGGNDFKQMIREMKTSHHLFLCTANWYTCVDAKKFFDQPGDHAGEMETSVLMHIAPHLVHPMSEAGTGAEKKLRIQGFREGWAWTPREWTKATNDTGVGNPKAASAEKGERYLRAVTEKLGDFLVSLAAADVNDLYE